MVTRLDGINNSKNLEADIHFLWRMLVQQRCKLLLKLQNAIFYIDTYKGRNSIRIWIETCCQLFLCIPAASGIFTKSIVNATKTTHGGSLYIIKLSLERFCFSRLVFSHRIVFISRLINSPMRWLKAGDASTAGSMYRGSRSEEQGQGYTIIYHVIYIND